ncbi:VOC family protein [Hoeflea sp. YIM 152468]|uniref:2-oxoadipate dioxygenase/decarboxylase HglS n=1 Tax=Hoeflea sp. YIM 152468 TaxID=3031759 RepID=UPI0023DC9494|nr:VOC family protein [Hoeflea sp. YIM 152468]MDF1608665.1 VOC family protein [Hoeflea sp. YIM 152468]
MTESRFVSPDTLRARFSAAMSAMYRTEVPAYGSLIKLVETVNAQTLAADPGLAGRLEATDSLNRISEERHGAIRLGTPGELCMMRRVFAVMGMYPVGYYDLSEGGVPVHSTAFRPVGEAHLNRNPFRVFTSLLRHDLIADNDLRAEVADILSKRDIFTPAARALVEKAERDGGLLGTDSVSFVTEVLETFRWHDKAVVDAAMYARLHAAHRLIADIVSFRGPHINHLTPRTLDIDTVQERMFEEGITPKAVVEGPPSRLCPILLRQTSFKALDEQVAFIGKDGGWESGSHTARFGEIEQRGVALTPQGRTLYDALLARARAISRPAPDGSNAAAYRDALARAFTEFPDDWDAIRRAGLGYFTYSMTGKGLRAEAAGMDLETAIEHGLIRFDPIIYEDFLPVSAAGIFLSNLGEHDTEELEAGPNQQLFEADLGAPVLDEFAHYAAMEKASIQNCMQALQTAEAAE